jgi:hypothetical protein
LGAVQYQDWHNRGEKRKTGNPIHLLVDDLKGKKHNFFLSQAPAHRWQPCSKKLFCCIG